MRSFNLSNDAECIENLRDVVRFHVDPSTSAPSAAGIKYHIPSAKLAPATVRLSQTCQVSSPDQEKVSGRLPIIRGQLP